MYIYVFCPTEYPWGLHTWVTFTSLNGNAVPEDVTDLAERRPDLILTISDVRPSWWKAAS